MTVYIYNTISTQEPVLDPAGGVMSDLFTQDPLWLLQTYLFLKHILKFLIHRVTGCRFVQVADSYTWNCLNYRLNIFYFQNCTLQHINNTITQRNRIGTKAYSLYSSSPERV